MDPNSSDGRTEATPNATAPAAQNSDVNSTPQSSSEGDKGAANETLLDRFTKLSQEDSEAGKSPDPQSGEDSGTKPAVPNADDKAATGDAELGEVTKEELDGYKPATRKRIETLLRQRTEVQEQLKAAQEQTEPLTRRAQAYDQMAQFVQTAGLTTEEVNEGFNIMSLLRNDPEKALQALLPYVEKLQGLTGEALPDDLKAKVDAGQIDEESARELSRSRAKVQLTTQKVEESTERQAAEQVQHLADSVGRAMTVWETQWKQSDPDYALLQPHVQREIERLLLSGKLPKSETDAQAMASEVRERIRKELSAFKPKPQAITPVQGTVQRDNAPAPTSMLEAMQRRSEGTY